LLSYGELSLIKKAYVYKITHRSGKFYFGSRTPTNQKIPSEQDLWVRYFTSSKYIADIINSDGVESFTPEVIKIYEDRDLAFWDEQDLIKENIKNPLCLNHHYVNRENGEMKFSTLGISPSEKRREEIGNEHRGQQLGPQTEKQKKLIGDSQRGIPRKKHTPESKQKIVDWLTGRKHSPETRAKMSAWQTGRTLPESTKAKISATIKARKINKGAQAQ
jgi:hypothetical protein